MRTWIGIGVFWCRTRVVVSRKIPAAPLDLQCHTSLMNTLISTLSFTR